jgi:uncharacterized protein YoxC
LDVIRLIRDIAVIILAVENIVLLAILIFLALQLWRFVKLGKQHVTTLTGSASGLLGTVKETAETAKHTAQDVQGTVGYVNDRTARPIIELYSAINGAKRFAEAIFSPNRPPADPEDRHER